MDVLKERVSATEIDKFLKGKKKNQAYVLEVDKIITFALVQDSDRNCYYIEPDGKGTATIYSLKTTEEKLEIFNKIRELQ